MELLFGELNIDRILDGAAMQALIEGDVPLPPRGDGAATTGALEVLSSNGRVETTGVVVGAGMVTVTGSVTADIVCKAGEEVIAFSTSAAFSQDMPAEAAKPGCAAHASACLQSLEVEAVGSRLRLNAIADVTCAVTDASPLRVLGGIRGADDVEFRPCELETETTTEVGGTTVRLRDDIPAQSTAYGTAQEILLCTAAAHVRDVLISGEAAVCEGTLSYTALARGREGRLFSCVYHVPFTAEADVSGIPAGATLFAKAAVEDSSLRPIGESTGLLCAEALLCVSVFASARQTVTVPVDAYSPSLPFTCRHGEVRTRINGARVCGKQAINESIAVPEGLPDAARTVYASARAIVTGTSCDDAAANEMTLSGLVFARIIYESDAGTLYAFSEDIPFVLNLPVKDGACNGGCNGAEADASVLFVTVTGAGRRLELAYTLAYSVRPETETRISPVLGIDECTGVDTGHGVVIYFAGKNETLFDIGRAFNVSRARLREANPGLCETLTEGQRVIMLV